MVRRRRAASRADHLSRSRSSITHRRPNRAVDRATAVNEERTVRPGTRGQSPDRSVRGLSPRQARRRAKANRSAPAASAAAQAASWSGVAPNRMAAATTVARPRRCRRMREQCRSHLLVRLPPAQHQGRQADGEIHHQGDGADRGERHERSAAARGSTPRPRRRGWRSTACGSRVHLAEPARQVAVLGEREDRARAVESWPMLLPVIEMTEPAIEIIAAPAAPRTDAAPSASGVRVAATSGRMPVATNDVSDITIDTMISARDERERHVAPRICRFARQHAGHFISAISKDQQDRRGRKLFASTRRHVVKCDGIDEPDAADDEDRQRQRACRWSAR